jgi:hypothetical protein
MLPQIPELFINSPSASTYAVAEPHRGETALNVASCVIVLGAYVNEVAPTMVSLCPDASHMAAIAA